MSKIPITKPSAPPPKGEPTGGIKAGQPVNDIRQVPTKPPPQK